MSINIGIIGLAKSGRTTIFNALTAGKADSGSFTHESKVPQIGVTKVPDPRLKTLTEIFQPKKLVPAEAKYTDIGASVKDLAQDKGIGGQLLNELSNLDALIHVVRDFSDECLPHIAGSLDVKRDIANMDLELTFSDLALVERRLEKIDVSLKGAKPPERESLLREQKLILKIKTNLENDVPVRELELTKDEIKSISHYQFLTAKPLLILVNIGEDELPHTTSMEKELKANYSKPKCDVVALCGKLEMELTQLDSEAATELRHEFGLEESGLERTIRLSCALLELIFFFTTASDELKAWSIRKGTTALKGAGKIHSDMERGFIRAEVVSFTDLLKCSTISEVRKHGLLRLEGKNYIIQDGDIITFLFNV